MNQTINQEGQTQPSQSTDLAAQVLQIQQTLASMNKTIGVIAKSDASSRTSQVNPEARPSVIASPAIENSRNVNNMLSSNEYNAAFNQYLRTGDVNNIPEAIKQSFDTASVPTGSRIADIINVYLMKNSVIRRFANQFTTSRDIFEVIRNNATTGAAWNDGSSSVSAISGYSKQMIQLNNLIAQPQISQRALDDINMDIEMWLGTELGRLFLMAENDAFINGSGTSSANGGIGAMNFGNQPLGILKYNTNDSSTNKIETIKTAGTGAITADDLMNLIGAMSDVYTQDSVIIMNAQTVQVIRKLKDATGQYLWMPGILSGRSDTLLGIPLFTMSNLPAVTSASGITANTNIAIMANLREAYTIVDAPNIVVQNDPFTAKPNVLFYATKKIGGTVVNPNAVKILQAK